MSKTRRSPMGAHERFPLASKLLECLLKGNNCDTCCEKDCGGRAIYEKNKEAEESHGDKTEKQQH